MHTQGFHPYGSGPDSHADKFYRFPLLNSVFYILSSTF